MPQDRDQSPGDGATDLQQMGHALRLARSAGRRGEVPVGALVVRQGLVLGAAGNRVERAEDASAHAELLALRRAAARLGSWRLSGCTIYSTLEPCPMCAGAILLGRLDRVVYGALDPRKGAHQSVYDVLAHPGGNHHPEVIGGCRAKASTELLEHFFRELRAAR